MPVARKGYYYWYCILVNRMVRLLEGIEGKCGRVASKVGVEDTSEWASFHNLTTA
jgi:hypothetical protein